jgi:hypothetical protein
MLQNLTGHLIKYLVRPSLENTSNFLIEKLFLIHLANVELPNVELPNVELLNVELPNAELPNVKLPNVESYPTSNITQRRILQNVL